MSAGRQETVVGVSLALASRTEIRVSPESFSERLSNICKGLGGQFRSGSWYVSADKYADLLEGMLSVGGLAIVGDGIPSELVSLFIADKDHLKTDYNNDRDVETELARIPASLMDALYPFQKEGVRFALTRRGRCIIGDDMGLGKTLQALAVAAVYRDEWPVLVVCPSSLRVQWAVSFETWLGTPREQIVVVLTGKADVLDRNKTVVIVSYDLAVRLAADIGSRRFRVVIADESHMIKSPQAQRTKRVRPLLKSASRAILLTGTPALSRPIEMFTQLEVLAPRIFRSVHQYGVRYCNAHQGKFGWDASGASNVDELHTVLENTVMIRRLKKDVLTQLPEKLRQKITIGISPSSSKTVSDGMKRLEGARNDLTTARTDSDLFGARARCRRILMELYGETGLAKLPNVVEYLRDKLPSLEGNKVIVFAHHRIVIDGICAMLTKEKVGHMRIDGQTPPVKRAQLVEQFQTTPSVKVAVLSITAAGVGLTLTAANLVIFAEMFWNPGALRQAEDRAHRIGQTDRVVVQYLVADGTVDNIIWYLVTLLLPLNVSLRKLIEHKLDIVGRVLDGRGDAMGADVIAIDGLEGDEKAEGQFAVDVLDAVAVTTTTTTTTKSRKHNSEGDKPVDKKQRLMSSFIVNKQ